MWAGRGTDGAAKVVNFALAGKFSAAFFFRAALSRAVGRSFAFDDPCNGVGGAVVGAGAAADAVVEPQGGQAAGAVVGGESVGDYAYGAGGAAALADAAGFAAAVFDAIGGHDSGFSDGT